MMGVRNNAQWCVTSDSSYLYEVAAGKLMHVHCFISHVIVSHVILEYSFLYPR